MSKTKGTKRGKRRALRQGDLDGLCGVYSVVNACRRLVPEIDSDGASWLFSRLMRSLRKVGANPSHAIVTGVGRSAVIALLHQAIAAIEGKYDVKLAVRRLPRAQRQIKRLDELWAVLARTISSGKVAILGLGGNTSHWTVAVTVTAKQIRLFDSSRMKVLRRADCSIAETSKRTAIPPSYVIVVSRREE